jgi:hypothetical protein
MCKEKVAALDDEKAMAKGRPVEEKGTEKGCPRPSMMQALDLLWTMCRR